MALAVRLRALGADVRVCAPPDAEFAELLAGVGARVGDQGDWGRRAELASLCSARGLTRGGQ